MKNPDDLKRELTGSGEKEASEQLPPITTIHIDETVRGIRYQGVFTFKVPTLQENILIGRMKAEYLPDGGTADRNAGVLVEQICFLEVTLQEPRPAWWRPFEFYESDIVSKVYLEGLAYANKFLGRDKDGNAAGGQDAGEQQRGNAASDEGDVGESLRGPDERPPTVIAHSKRAG